MAGRVTHEIIEVGVIPDSANARVTQDVIEVAVIPTDAVVRETFYVLEVAILDPGYTPVGPGQRAYVTIIG
jgi:hypothetical protein